MQSRLSYAPFCLLLLAACSGGGSGPEPDTLNQGSFSVDDFPNPSTHGPGHHPLSERVTALISNKELAVLDPGGGGVFADFDDSPTWPFDGWSNQGTFDHSASGQLDSDPEEEHLIARLDTGAGLLRITTLESGGSWQERYQLASGGATCPALALGDVDGDGLDELAVVWADAGSLRLAIFDEGLLMHEEPLFSGYSLMDYEHVGLELADLDADSRDEIVVLGNRSAYWTYSVPGPTLAIFDDAQAAHHRLVEQEADKMKLWGGPSQLVLADTDGDDIRLRYTGNKELALGSPLPIVLMAAPPCKAGISQKYDRSFTEYKTSTTNGKAYSVKNGITAGVWVGYEASDLFDLFSASGKAKFGMEFARTETQALEHTVDENYSTIHDADVIVFQGTLYESYEYEVVSAEDPSALGQLMTIDVPVARNIYKYSVDNYNATVDPEHAIDPSILGHTIGDPSSYMRKWDAEALVGSDPTPVPGQGYVGWMCEPQTLGWATSSKGVTIELKSQSTTEDMLGWSVTAEQEFKAGSFVAGFSVGILQDYVHQVSVAETTSYHGEVGDVVQKADYDHWNYNFGLVTYTRGLHSDASNEPLATEVGIVPYQIETYYTEPIGAGY